MVARSRSQISPVETGQSWLESLAGSKRYYTNDILHSSSKTIGDVVTKGYRELIAKGHIINNPCALTSSLTTSGGGSYRATLKSNPGAGSFRAGDGSTTHWASQWGSGAAGTFHPDVLSRSADMSIAKLQAIARIDSTPHQFLEDVFEIRQTLRFIRNPLKSLLDLSRQFRTANRRSGKSALQRGRETAGAASDVWLTYRFAATPLVRSTMDALEVLDKGIGKVAKRRSARGSDTLEVTRKDSLNPSSMIFTRESKLNDEARANILYEVSNPVSGYSHELGLRASDIPETLWAVVPLSFMVDRVWDISKTIGGFANLANPSVKILAASTTRKTLTYSKVRLVDENAPSYDLTINGDDYIVDNFTYNRDLWSPSLSDLVPPFTPENLVKDVTSILDLTTLIISNFGR